jgi:hypothetical protein
MSLSHLFRKFSHPNPARPAPLDDGRDPSSENSHELPHARRHATEPTESRFWGWRTSSTDDRFSSSVTLTPGKSTAETRTPEAGVYEEPLTGFTILQSSPSMEPHQETSFPEPKLAPDKLNETWKLVKRGMSDSDLNLRLNAFGKLWYMLYFCPVL